MKLIITSRQFEKHYKERIAQNEPVRRALREALWALVEDPSSVHAHSLQGKMSGKYAFDVAPDCRVIYREKADTLVLVDIGTHDQVYER